MPGSMVCENPFRLCPFLSLFLSFFHLGGRAHACACKQLSIAPHCHLPRSSDTGSEFRHHGRRGVAWCQSQWIGEKDLTETFSLFLFKARILATQKRSQRIYGVWMQFSGCCHSLSLSLSLSKDSFSDGDNDDDAVTVNGLLARLGRNECENLPPSPRTALNISCHAFISPNRMRRTYVTGD